MKFFKSKIFKIIIYIFAAIGFVFTMVFIGMQFGIFNVPGSNAARNKSLNIPKTAPPEDCTDAAEQKCDWNKTVEWDVLKTAFTKDAPIINQVSTQVGISPMMLVATISPEQIRFFTSNRESFKKYFEPLKILVSLSQFSLGISGIKEDTAKQIEAYANDPTSPFYPGAGAVALIAYPPNVDHDTELFNRLTDEHNHYYSYLYTALFIKEIESQWGNAGFDITQQPEVIATLFNLGFDQSVPKANPVVSGSPITLAGNTYIYGELGALVYNSNEFDMIFTR
ncbi:MAG: hypothetical protein P4L63_01210 [Candidatus Pacebacteria bacterium]|nr:hypothetical protein [Candidatus Paceibacterota bacterium]